MLRYSRNSRIFPAREYLLFYSIFIDRKAREIVHLVTSVRLSVCPSVRLRALSQLFCHGFGPEKCVLFKVKRYSYAFPLRNKLSAEDANSKMNSKLFPFLIIDLMVQHLVETGY